MELLERSYRILVVSSAQKTMDALLGVLREEHRYRFSVATDGAQARRRLLEEPADIVLINTPLTDEFGTGLALDISEQNAVGVLLLVKTEHCPEVNGKVSPYGILTVSRPTNAAILRQTLTLLCATRERLRRMEQKTASIEEKMEEIRLVNRAKWLLIEQLRMTEPEAHRFIEKTAMDRCVTRREIAATIIQTYS